MLLQTNSYIVPKDKRSEHTRLLQRFRQTLARLGCDHFEAYEQVGQGWATGEPTGRFVQLMRFRDRAHQQEVQSAERTDPAAQALIREFCELINFPYQQEQGLFAVGFYRDIFSTEATRSMAEPVQAQLSGDPIPMPRAPDEQESPPAQSSVHNPAGAAVVGDVADDPEPLADQLLASEESSASDQDDDAQRNDDRAAPDRALHP
jgi:hypothetical protein